VFSATAISIYCCKWDWWCCSGGRLCSFSPCIEQVQRSCSVMHDVGFTDVTTLECLQRVLDVRSVSVPVADLGYGPMSPGPKLEFDNNPVNGGIQIVERLRPQKQKNIKHSPGACADSGDDNKSSAHANEDEETVAKVAHQTCTSTENSDSHNKRHCKVSYHFMSAVPVSQMTGHTGYLTFATLYPK